MKTDQEQGYQYTTTDLYAARCGKLHSFSITSTYAKKDNTKIFGYHGDTKHAYDPKINSELVIISVPTLIRDLSKAIRLFVKNIVNDPDLKSRVDSRINTLYEQFSISKYMMSHE